MKKLLKMSKIDFSSTFMPMESEMAPTAVKLPRYFTPTGYRGRISSAVAPSSPAAPLQGNTSTSSLSIQESSISVSLSPFLPPIEAPPVVVQEKSLKPEEKQSKKTYDTSLNCNNVHFTGETQKLEKIKPSYVPLSANKTFMYRHRKPLGLSMVNKQETIKEDATLTSIQFMGPDDGTRKVGATKYNRPTWVRRQVNNSGSKRCNYGFISMEIQGEKVKPEKNQRAITEARKADHPYRLRLPMEASGGEQGTKKDKPGASRQATGHQQRSVRNQHQNLPRFELHYVNFSDLL